MIELFLGLLLAHIIGDFVFFPQKWGNGIREKSVRSGYFWLHMIVLIVGLSIFVPLAYRADIQMLGVDFIWIGFLYLLSHGVLDGTQHLFYTSKNKRSLFTIKQIALFLIILILVTVYYREEVASMTLYNNEFLLLLAAVLTQSFVLAAVIKFAMSRWNIESEDEQASLSQAGKYIGMLERLLIFGFVVVGHWEVVGFLLAAKSIFRFGDLSRAKDRKLTEYVLIGTLLSFFLALVVTFFYQILYRML